MNVILQKMKLVKINRLLNPLYLLIIISIGAVLRFYKLDWGEGYFFHPDEYHLTISVNQLSYPSQMHPHLFSYGSFPVYLIYFTKLIFNLETSPFLIGRFYSALFSTLTIVVIYKISLELFKERKNYAYLSTFFVAITPGLIQQAHFSTPESNLTFFLMITLLLLIKWFEKDKLKYYLASASSLGVAAGTKIVATTFLPLALLSPFIKVLEIKGLLRKIFALIKSYFSSSIFILITFLSFFIVFPYAILDFKGLRSSMNYEFAVASGKQIVFYNRAFIGTKPILFQLTKILPYALGIPLLIFGIAGFLIMSIHLVDDSINKRRINSILLAILSSFLFFFLPNALLYAKWTRFIAPTFPFFSIFAAYAFYQLFLKSQNSPIISLFLKALAILLMVSTSVWTLSFWSIYSHQDSRISATGWINKNIPKNSYILTETGNTLEAPLTGEYTKIPFDFYNLDERYELKNELVDHLVKSDYFIIQSRRIFINHQNQPYQFPLTSRFYDLLFSEQLGFEKIQEFNSYPQLSIGHLSFVIPDELAEETWSVFDHPVIRVYKKVNPKEALEYEKLLEI